MGELKQINIKNRSYYFYNDITDFDEFDESKIKVESNDNLPTDNIIDMHQVKIIIRLVFQKGKKLYPQFI